VKPHGLGELLMIKLPKEVNKMIKALEGKGFETYVVGGCVRDSIIGQQPLDWDIATAASLSEVTALFPEAKVLSEKYGVGRIDFTKPNGQSEDGEGIIIDIASFRIEGGYSDYKKPDEVTFTNSIVDDLRRRDFTMNAIADNPGRALVDPYNGLDDIKQRLIKTIDDPLIRFEENPIRMLRAIRFAAELDFDLHQAVYEAIVAKAHLLGEIPVEAIREQFEKIIISEHVGKGLKMLTGTGLMTHIIGEEVSLKMSRRELEDFSIYVENISKTQPIRLRRLALFYKCFDVNHSESAIQKLKFSGKDEQFLLDGVHLVDKLYFLTNKYEMKKFMAQYGLERYDFLDNLSKAQRIVYDLPLNRVLSRKYILDNIKEFSEPIFIEDLAIDGTDLIEEGIAEGERIGKILNMLLDVVHMKPKLNTKKEMLAYARKFTKSKLAASMRKIKYIR
jgi:tRNA nucleotidyltransferase (CCA-adding enzyme)